MSDGARPAYVRRRLARLSRDRWVPGHVVVSAAQAFAERAGSGNVNFTARSAYAFECRVVGMLMGEPPFYTWNRCYAEFLEIAGTYERAAKRGQRKPVPIEVLILKLLVQERTRETVVMERLQRYVKGVV